jgi:deoxyhypusine synthase
MKIRDFVDTHYLHFNAASLKDAAIAYERHLQSGGKMFFTMAGAMSTAELGKSLAEMIRQDKVHAICCTGANLEEDIFNLVAHNHYKRVPQYRELSREEEANLRDNGFNRVTDTCIPEEEAIRAIEKEVLELWKKADQEKKSYFPYEFMYQLLGSGVINKKFQIDPKNSWLLAAYEKNLPIFTPGFEDSTLGNVVVSQLIKGNLSSYSIYKSGLEQMTALIDWYNHVGKDSSIGFFQIGGGIAGDFPICVVPLIKQDLKKDCNYWGYFCQISDSTTSYGSYSGAVPNEKITWGKLDIKTPSYIIESDASIVAPLMFGYILNW